MCQNIHVAVINNGHIDLWKTLTMHFISSQSKVQDDVVEAWNSKEKLTGGVYMLFRYQAYPLSANKWRLCTSEIVIETKQNLEREKKFIKWVRKSGYKHASQM